MNEELSSGYSLFLFAVAFIISNFIYQVFTNEEWGTAFERSLFFLVGLLVGYFLYKSRSLK